MASFGAPHSSSGSPPQGHYGHAGFRQFASSPMATSSKPGVNSSSPMGSDVTDIPGHRTDQPATGRSLFDPEAGTCTPAPRRRGRIMEFLSDAAADAPRAFSGFAPPYVGGGSMDYDIDDEEDWDEDWEDEDNENGGVPASFLGGWDSGTGQQEDSENWDEDNDEVSDDDEGDVDSEGEALSRAPSAKRGQK